MQRYLISLAVLVSCGHGGFNQNARATGSCEAACRHYIGCTPKASKARHQSCLSECEAIFVTKGQPDRESLRDYERLECVEAVRFIEG